MSPSERVLSACEEIAATASQAVVTAGLVGDLLDVSQSRWTSAGRRAIRSAEEVQRLGQEMQRPMAVVRLSGDHRLIEFANWLLESLENLPVVMVAGFDRDERERIEQTFMEARARFEEMVESMRGADGQPKTAEVERLLAASSGFDAKARACQAGPPTEIDAFRVEYRGWLAEALALLDPDSRRSLRGEYEGSAFTSKIKAFLDNPNQPNPFVTEETLASGLTTTWTYDVERCFVGPMAEQRLILQEALARESASARVEPAASTDEALDRCLLLLSGFGRFVAALRHRPRDRVPLTIADEYDVQYLLGALLRGAFDDVRQEEFVPSVAGGNSRQDFLLKREKIVVEAKVARHGHADAPLGAEIVVDIRRYEAHPDCHTLLVLVFDKDRCLQNPNGLIADLEGHHGPQTVRVLVVS